jgi:hypothetical protein
VHNERENQYTACNHWLIALNQGKKTVIKLPVLDKVFDLTDALLFIVDSVPVENLRATLFSEILLAPTETEQVQI